MFIYASKYNFSWTTVAKRSQNCLPTWRTVGNSWTSCKVSLIEFVKFMPWSTFNRSTIKTAWNFEIKARCHHGILSEEKLNETAIATTFSCYCVLKPFRNHPKLQTSSLLNNCFNNIGVFILFHFSFFTFQKSFKNWSFILRWEEVITYVKSLTLRSLCQYRKGARKTCEALVTVQNKCGYW